MAIISGTDSADNGPYELRGTIFADEIYGLAGNDSLVGFDSDDLLVGGADADELYGGYGFDLASYRSSDQGVAVDLEFSDATGGHATGDQLCSIEGVIGSAFVDTLVGDDGRNVLRGEAGNDGLNGEGGDDRLEGGGGNDGPFGSAGNDELRGGAGIDSAIFGDSVSAVVADLASGTASGASSGNDRLFSIERLSGTAFGDQLFGNDGANVLYGVGGADSLTGRGGADKFDYDRTGDSSPKAPDLILDFSRAQGDKIDLAGIDAKLHATGNQAFAFIGQNQFSGEGQLRFFQRNGDTFIEANTDNSVPGADMVIVLDSLVTPKGLDFFL